MGRPLHLPPTAVDVEPLFVESRECLEIRPRRVRALEILRPVTTTRWDLVVEPAKRVLLLCRRPIRHDDQEIAVAVEIAGSERERAGQISTHEVVSEDRLDPSHELS